MEEWLIFCPIYKVNMMYVTKAHSKKYILPTAVVRFKYLSADCASKAPHSFIGSVVFTATSHFKGEGDCIAFHLKFKGGKCTLKTRHAIFKRAMNF